MINIRIIDILSGKNIWPYYKLYRQTQWYSKEQMEELQLHKLKNLLTHCYDNVEYYRNIIQKNNINIKNIESIDIIKQFPILTKEIIQENYNAFIPRNNNKIKGVKTKQTGGTTGNILFVRNDASTRSSQYAAYLRYLDWTNKTKNEKTLILMGGHIKKQTLKMKIKHIFSNFFTNSYSIDIYNTSEQTTLHILKHLKSGKYSHIRSYPQFLFSIAQIAEQEGLQFHIKSISTTAEPVTETHRNLFKKVFHASVFDQYGCGEIGAIAFECSNHEGLHIAEERVIVEVNNQNQLIITDLDNFTMPFIRYHNYDEAIIDEKSCSCGRQSRLIKKIDGRTCDYVIGMNDQKLHWAFFWHLFFDSNVAHERNLKKFQILQKQQNKIIIRLVADEFSQEETSFILNSITQKLGNIEIEISYENQIENSKTGKYRPVINETFSQ